MVYTLYLKHATRQRPERTGYHDIDLERLLDFGRGYVRGVNDVARDGRYSAIICDDQLKPIKKVTKEGWIENA